MKKTYILLCFLLLFVLTSCDVGEFQSSQVIEAPHNNEPPLRGKWTVTKFIDGPYKRGDSETFEDISDIEALFGKEAVIVGKDYSLNPSYKKRKVDINDYLFYNYKIDIDYLGIASEEIHILTVTGDDGYFNEFIKYDNEKMISFHDEKFFFFERQVDTVSEEEIKRYIEIEKSVDISSKVESVYTLNSGLLLGIKTRYNDEKTDLENWKYNTIWIRTNNREISNIYKIEGILLPRKRGFWYVDSKRQKVNENIRDVIFANQKGKFKEENMDTSLSPIEDFFSKNTSGEYLSLLTHILYVGNDYVSVEEINPATNRKKLRVYPIDYLEEGNPTMISNLINVEDFYESARVNLKLEDNNLDEKNFGIDRKNAHWMLKGRLNYTDNQKELYKDFNIKSIPPKEIVQYDELIVSWSLIKSRFPQAVNAFTSPNEDIILIVTREDIEIYPLRDGDILPDKLGNIELDANQKIVMAEWGIGKYSNLWEQEILKNYVTELEY